MRGKLRAGLATVVLSAAAALTLPGASSAGSAGLTAVPPGTRAMWLWGADPVAEVMTWAVQHQVSDIFVYVSPDVLTNGDLARLQQMKQRAGTLKIKLRALGGDSSWTTDHAAALAWQKAVVTTGIFAGIHLDVEPYLTDGWTTDQEATQQSYLKLLDKMRMASPLPLEADVPFWYGEYKIGNKNLADEILKRVNAITVMSYRDTGTGANSMLALSQDWLTRGAAAGKRVRLGAETNPLPDCTYCTFSEEGAATMTRELAKVDTNTRNRGAFAGVAIHHYGSWRTLKP